MTRCPPGCECNTSAEYLPPCSCGCGAVRERAGWSPLLFKCTRCPQAFAFMADLRDHLRGHLRSEAIRAARPLIEDISIPCPFCRAAVGKRCDDECPAKDGA